MHPKIEAVFPHVLPFSEEEIWNKLRNEKWYGFWGLASSEFWIDFFEGYPQYIFRASICPQNFSIEYYDGNFCTIERSADEISRVPIYALLWNPKIVK